MPKTSSKDWQTISMVTYHIIHIVHTRSRYEFVIFRFGSNPSEVTISLPSLSNTADARTTCWALFAERARLAWAANVRRTSMKQPAIDYTR